MGNGTEELTETVTTSNGERPKRGGQRHQVIYRECDSDDEDYETVLLLKTLVEAEKNETKILTPSQSHPPLSALQMELKQICRQGDKEGLKTFLANNPEINLDFKDPDGGSTLLTDAVIKTAQFTDIVSLLLDAGADLEITDALGNTPLHNAVLYYPSTHLTVDLLLSRGADVTVKNHEGSTAFHMSDDKDLKNVLKELKKKQTQKVLSKRTRSKSKGYSDSPELRKLVNDPIINITKDSKISVKFNNPVKLKSPGLLKRKRKAETSESPSMGKSRKRIRFSNFETDDDESKEELDNCSKMSEVEVDSKNSEKLVNDILNGLLHQMFRRRRKS